MIGSKSQPFDHTRLGFFNVLALWSIIWSFVFFFFFYSLLALELAILHPFQFFWIFGICFNVWIRAGQNMVSTPTKIPPLLSSNQTTFSPIFFPIFLSLFFISLKSLQSNEPLQTWTRFSFLYFGRGLDSSCIGFILMHEPYNNGTQLLWDFCHWHRLLG